MDPVRLNSSRDIGVVNLLVVPWLTLETVAVFHAMELTAGGFSTSAGFSRFTPCVDVSPSSIKAVRNQGNSFSLLVGLL